jgi:hypothetical protein
LQETRENAARAANIMYLCFMIQYVLMLAFPTWVLVARRELADFAQWNRKQVRVSYELDEPRFLKYSELFFDRSSP